MQMNLVGLIISLQGVLSGFSSTNRCGSFNNGLLCEPNGLYGACCSGSGYCGSTAEYCSIDSGCQSGCQALTATNFTNTDRCGAANNGLTCNPAGKYGACCSKNGYCGSTAEYCSIDSGCQSGCQALPSTNYTNTDRCGTANKGLMCNPRGPYGPCCSKNGYCGKTDDYCTKENECQSGCSHSIPPKTNYTSSDRCGTANNGLLCDPNGKYGSCCSKNGYCGKTGDYCSIDSGCQSGCSLVVPPTSNYTNSDRCGTSNNGLMCNPEGKYGGCCSKNGYCGATEAYCSIDNGCQSGCTALPPPPPIEPIPGCGDGFCDARTETCISCPSDCKCDLEYLDKCITPGHVALTFDDGPDQFAPNLLKIAKQLKVKLTLFVIGSKLSNPTYRTYLKQYYNAGHAIASHTSTHPFITKLTDAQLRDEMIKTDDAIFSIIKKRPIFMRNPYSDTEERTMALLQSMGYRSIFTSLDTEDTVYGDSDPKRILSNVVTGLKADPKAAPYVITQHETFNVSINYLPDIVAEIRRRKYTIVTIDQCFGTKGAYRRDRCGDGICTGYIENCQTCPKDCGTCPKLLH